MPPKCRRSFAIANIVIDEDNITRGNADNKNDESLVNTSVNHYEDLSNYDENDIIIKKASIRNGYQVKI